MKTSDLFYVDLLVGLFILLPSITATFTPGLTTTSLILQSCPTSGIIVASPTSSIPASAGVLELKGLFNPFFMTLAQVATGGLFSTGALWAEFLALANSRCKERAVSINSLKVESQ